ncbi:hypothetical protein CNAG_00376 [Cryptococcus neoformans var. grubii H99]|uniref:Uncharacterized protein n=1 Tax=Cryptococcus neoformans (strain H99 / ATCC 208821 / CBS 10515 / FGSC 9487) TaxID=235443 RepID=J9VDZ3_CRYN9|nr:hypothetical protein CNAG_00376 [Cryptococcus neoformans var. grubii H99]AFR92512.1 hypothetical protein CNAG_00376 [Cryptococcus neoformans var. grubii H99]AUB21948.1 hypothetical protein CKF44_00376 [Cryptococcus neoformans var. grubii]|eukprot:XP_012046681.1 hypothetical protein CNAG_00376 [Cryptococcus neoformans var. grubii H99]
MADSMTLAHEHKINNPRESYQKVADLYEVSKPSLYDRHTGVHSSHTTSAPRRPSIVQEEELVNKINGCAERSTLLTPRHAVEFAEAVYGGEMGVKLGSRFVQRPRNTIHSRFFSYKELGRLQADIPEIRRAFYYLVKDVYDIGLKAPHLIFSMDRAAFELSSSRRMRRVAPRTNLRNGQAGQSSNEHIASVACIGIDSAPVPPFIIYQIHHLSRLTTARKEIEEQAPATPPLLASTEDPLIPRNLRILRANNRAVRQGKVAPERVGESQAAQGLGKATRGSKKEQRYPKSQLFDSLCQEEHAEELAVRKAEEEDARRKRRRTARARRNETESNAAHACTLGSSGTS